MLRALGIAFIACSLMLFGITLGGTAWWLVSSRVITIRGVNDQTAAHSEAVEQPRPSELADNGAGGVNDEKDTHSATTRRTPVRTASYATSSAADDPKLSYLQQLNLIRITGTVGQLPVTFTAPFEQTPVFPTGTTALKFTYSAPGTAVPDGLKDCFTIAQASPTGDTINGNKTEYTLTYAPAVTGPVELRVQDPYSEASHLNATVIACANDTNQLNLATGPLKPHQNSPTQSLILYDDYLRIDLNPSIDISNITVYCTNPQPSGTRRMTVTTSIAYDSSGNRLESPSIQLHNSRIFAPSSGASLAYLYTVRVDAIGNHLSSNLVTLTRGPSATRNDLLVSDASISTADAQSAKEILLNGIYYLQQNKGNISASSANSLPPDSFFVLNSNETSQYLGDTTPPSKSVSLPVNTKTLQVQLFQGSRIIASGKPINISIIPGDPKPPVPDTSGFTAGDTGIIRLKFDPAHPMKADAVRKRENYTLSVASPNTNPLSDPEYDQSTGVVTLRFSRDIPPGDYTLTLKPGIVDIFDRPIANLQAIKVTRISSSSSPDITRGLTGLSGESPEYKEFTDPRETTTGFNPSDKVISRMARLYYFRDAHRVVQLINRKAQSFNRAAVDAQEQVADAARKNADQSTVDRREAENSAIRAAKEARAAETALEEHQQALITSRKTLAALTDDLAQIDGVIRELQQQGAAIQSEFTLEDLSNLEKLESKQNAALTDTERSRLAELEAKETANPPLTSAEQIQITQLRSKRTNFPDLTPAESTQLRTLQKKRTDGLRRDQLIASAPAVQLSDLDLADPAVPVRRLSQTRDALRQQIRDTESNIRQEETIVRQLSSTVQSERDQEIKATAKWESLEQQERLKRDEQFRREVAAGNADPDTYVAGKPNSNDPVAQVSLAVAGEGLIQMRGPRKGVNEVHRMINEIDSPVGQVKVAIHTVQVNGEHGDRMQEVAFRIQSYIDHSRFLTMQSSQLLRNAVVSVASRRAEAVASQCPPGASQQLMMQKYQEAFFGADFIHELRELDSEFLQNGNKLLSLHSMDTTSLSNALFLMALAKNDVRQEILGEFTMGLQTRLPQYELQFYQGSAPKPAWRDRTLAEKIKPGAIREKHLAPFEMMAQNAQFASLRGFFDVAVSNPDTMTPMQREFVKLAQIFKARLVTEVELRQRIMERALIEERVGNYQTTVADAVEREKIAMQEKENARTAVVKAAENVKSYTAPIRLAILRIREEAAATQLKSVTYAGYKVSKDLSQAFQDNDIAPDEQIPSMIDDINALLRCLEYIRQFSLLTKHQSDSQIAKKILDEARQALEEPDKTNIIVNVIRIQQAASIIEKVNNHITETVDPIESDFFGVQQLFAAVSIEPEKADDLLQKWSTFRKNSLKWLDPQAPALADSTEKQNLHQQASAMVRKIDDLLGIGSGISGSTLLEQVAKYRIAVAAAENVRRPLDHKKYLDMLIDDAEATCIDLIEGTRAQTSNIDNYLQRLGLALEDDFNKQFYQPAFRRAQEASYFYDVSVGQIETTSIVANNRAFAKVSPQATMEFDLPKRDILINEAANSALAAYNDYGALLGDPNFVALLKLYGGQSPANSFGGLGSPQVIRPLPGLPSGTDSQFMTSSTGSSPKIGSSLEALIPDPAVYKFETGTGYEIRPVIQPDGQAVVFHFDYLFGTNIREPVRADEKHLGRVRQHYIDTDVVSGNYELREVSTYRVALKAARSSRGVPFLEDIPGVGVLFRPAVNAESSLQENIILSQTVIYPTLFDLMGLRWAPAVSDLDSLTLQERKFVTSEREHVLRNEVFDNTSKKVDEFLRIETERRRPDLYRSQRIISTEHPLQYEAYPETMNYQDSAPTAEPSQNHGHSTPLQPGKPVPDVPDLGDIQPNGLPPIHPSSWSGANRGQGGQTQRPHTTGSRNSGHASLDATTPAKAGPLPRRTSPARTPQKQGNGWSIPGIRR